MNAESAKLVIGSTPSASAHTTRPCETTPKISTYEVNTHLGKLKLNLEPTKKLDLKHQVTTTPEKSSFDKCTIAVGGASAQELEQQNYEIQKKKDNIKEQFQETLLNKVNPNALFTRKQRKIYAKRVEQFNRGTRKSLDDCKQEGYKEGVEELKKLFKDYLVLFPNAPYVKLREDFENHKKDIDQFSCSYQESIEHHDRAVDYCNKCERKLKEKYDRRYLGASCPFINRNDRDPESCVHLKLAAIELYFSVSCLEFIDYYMENITKEGNQEISILLDLCLDDDGDYSLAIKPLTDYPDTDEDLFPELEEFPHP